MDDPKPSPAVIDLASRSRTIEAIKRYRRETGVDLVTAKSVVDALPRGGSTAVGKTASPGTGASGRAAAFLAATTLGFIGAAVTGLGLYRAQVASAWPRAGGEIVRSRFVSGTSKTSDRLDVEYTFEVAGQVHRGTRISYTLIWGTGFTRAAQSRYPTGTKVTAHYDPADPSRSVLEVRPPRLYLVVFVVSLIALAWGLARWIQQAQRERASPHTGA